MLARRRRGQRFAGQKGYPNDDATGMQLLGARVYLPLLGRFLTPDLIGHGGGLNLYAYCDNNPVTNVDPDGTQPQVGILLAIGNFAANYPTIRPFDDPDAAAIYAGNYFYPIGRNATPRRGIGGWIAKRGGKYRLATVEWAKASMGYTIVPSPVRASYEAFWHIHPFDSGEVLYASKDSPVSKW